MRRKSYSNAQLVNGVIALVGIILILVGILITEKDYESILISIGSSVLASAVVTGLSSRYLNRYNNAQMLIDDWGIERIYAARSEINPETNKMLKKAKELDICAMGLKGLRDAQGHMIEELVKQGLKIKILTLSPNCSFLDSIDKQEGLAIGSTKGTINSLLKWTEELIAQEKMENQVQVRVYNSYPFDFIFCIDGVVFTGPYQAKTSQQTITFKFTNNSTGAKQVMNYYNSLWEQYGEEV